LSERITLGLNNAPSTRYFKYLLQSCGIYFIHLAMQDVSIHHGVLVAVGAIGIVSLHVAYHFLKWLCLGWIINGLTLSKQAGKQILGARVTTSVSFAVSSMWNFVSRNVRRFQRAIAIGFMTHLNWLLTVWILAISIGTCFGLGGFMIVKVCLTFHALTR
jgi:hypothetical protein